MLSEIWVPQSLAQVLPVLTSFWPMGKPIWGKWANNYDVAQLQSRQVHETLNGVNPSSSFRDMRSAKSGPNLWQIWQAFGPWASPYGANEQMIMTRAAETCRLGGLVRIEPKLMGAIKSGRNWLNSKMCNFRELPTMKIRIIQQRIGLSFCWVITVIKKYK